MSKNICHDLKTERTDVLPPLPSVARIIPVGVYISIVGAILLTGFYYWQLKTAESDKQEWEAKEQTEKADQDNIAKMIKNIDDETKRADEVKSWVSGAKGVQFLVAQIARSMDEGSTISELRLTRENSDPTKIRASLRLNKGGKDQLERTLKTVQGKTGYRAYQERTKANPDTGEVDFDAILIKREQIN